MNLPPMRPKFPDRLTDEEADLLVDRYSMPVVTKIGSFCRVCDQKVFDPAWGSSEKPRYCPGCGSDLVWMEAIMNEPKQEITKFCKDCKHFVEDWRFPRCDKAREFEPVYGYTLLRCRDARTEKGACGIEGRLFELKEVE